MKRFFSFLGRTLAVLVGSYFAGIFCVGFFPSQISTCNQLMTGCFHRISSWTPFIGTICGNLEIAWNWIQGFCPHFGTMCGILIVLGLIRWAVKRR